MLRFCAECNRRTYHIRVEQPRQFDGHRAPAEWSCKPCLGEAEPVPGRRRQEDHDEAEAVSWDRVFGRDR